MDISLKKLGDMYVFFEQEKISTPILMLEASQLRNLIHNYLDDLIDDEQIKSIECPQCHSETKISKATTFLKCGCGLQIFLKNGIITKTEPIIKNCLTCNHRYEEKIGNICEECYDLPTGPHTHIRTNWIEKKEGNN